MLKEVEKLEKVKKCGRKSKNVKNVGVLKLFLACGETPHVHAQRGHTRPHLVTVCRRSTIAPRYGSVWVTRGSYFEDDDTN